MYKKWFGICFFVLGVSLTAWPQSTIDQPGTSHPTQEQIISANKLRAEQLKHPTFITLRLTSQKRDSPREEPSTTPAPYSVGDEISFQLFITQSLFDELMLGNYMSASYEYRPQLFKDGTPLSYTKEAQDKIDLAEHQAPSGSVFMVQLLSGREVKWANVNVNFWYGPLEPGHYQLTVRKHFVPEGDWAASNPVTFDVVTSKTDSDDLIKIKESVKENVGKEMHGWTYRSIEPIQGSRNVIIQQWQLNDIIVSVAVTRYESEAKAQDAFARFKDHLRVEENARTKNQGKPFRLIKEESNAWGDEGFVSDVLGSEAVAFRKGRFIVNVSVPQPADNKDVFFSRQFAPHVLKAIQDK